MNERHTYSCNGTIVFENVREHIRNNDFPRIPIGPVAGIDGCSIGMRVFNFGNSVVRPYINCPNDPTFKVETFFGIINTEGSSYTIKGLTSGFGGFFPFQMTAGQILDEKNKYLDEYGGILMEYGIQVESIKMNDEIWKFNFYDTVFNSQSMGNMISFISEKFLHCPKQLLTFHSKYFNSKSDENQIMEIPTDIDYKALEQCLQIAHGVRLQSSKRYYYTVLKAARRYSLSNVSYYYEQMLIEQDFLSIKDAILFGLNRYLALLLKRLESSKELKEILEDVDIETMSGEAMKKCAMFFFKCPK